MSTLTIIAIVVAAAAIAACVVLYLTLQKSKVEAEKRMKTARQTWENDQQAKLTTLRQQVLGSIHRELQGPVTAIITPLQNTRLETLPANARENMVKSLVSAQHLLKRLNMLLDFHYTGTAADTDFTFTLPKLAEPKVTYTPLEQQEEELKAEEKQPEPAPAQAAKPQPAAQHAAKPTPQPAPTPTAAQTPAATPAPTQQPRAAVEPVMPKPIASGSNTPVVNMAVDDSNAGIAANVAWENSAKIGEGEDCHPFTMLVVDDAPEMCRFARDFFRGEYNVITANNGVQALDKLKELERVDLVVSDVTMPLMNGLELCHAIKTNLDYSHIPVILLTGHTEDEMEMQGLKLGADDYITKPFNPETLRLRVKKFIEMRENRLRQFRDSDDVAASTLTTTDMDEDFIAVTIEIIEDHMSDANFTVEMLGDLLDVSRTYLYKKIINITGRGPGEFIRTIRMKRGKHLLETTQMQIAEVAAAVGYNTPKRFTENFKQEYGMTPTDYQRQIKGEA